MDTTAANYNCNGVEWWKHPLANCGWCADHRAKVIEGYIALAKAAGFELKGIPHV